MLFTKISKLGFFISTMYAIVAVLTLVFGALSLTKEGRSEVVGMMSDGYIFFAMLPDKMYVFYPGPLLKVGFMITMLPIGVLRVYLPSRSGVPLTLSMTLLQKSLFTLGIMFINIVLWYFMGVGVERIYNSLRR